MCVMCTYICGAQHIGQDIRSTTFDPDSPLPSANFWPPVSPSPRARIWRRDRIAHTLSTTLRTGHSPHRNVATTKEYFVMRIVCKLYSLNRRNFSYPISYMYVFFSTLYSKFMFSTKSRIQFEVLRGFQ